MIEHQDRKIDRLKAELGLAWVPASIFNSTGTQYLFFHELNRTTDQNNPEAYPIFFIEVDFALGADEVQISFPRDLIFINTPAVNYFKFPSILTTPRSTTFQFEIIKSPRNSFVIPRSLRRGTSNYRNLFLHRGPSLRSG